MPHQGRADHVTNAYENASTRARVIEVLVTSSGNYWCSTDPGNGSWGAWWNCS